MRSKRIVILLSAILICALPLNVANASSEVANPNFDNKSIVETGEILSLRTLNSKTFLGDVEGEYKCIIYPDNIHFIDNKGKYAEISNKLIINAKSIIGTQYKYSNEANSFAVRFADQGSEYPMIIEYHDKMLAMGLKSASEKPLTLNTKQKNRILSELLYPEATAVYTDVYPGIDLLYQAVANGVKEYIVLKQATQQNEFFFRIKCNGFKAVNTESGVSFVDEKGQTIFRIGQLFAIDNNEAYTENVTCEVVDDNDETTLKLVLDKQYLLDKDRQFPVIIDPSTMLTGADKTQDTFVSERYPTTNYYLNNYLRTGRDADYYTRWTYINFTFPTTIPSSGITRASLNMEKYSGATPNIRAYRVDGPSWDSNTITWADKRTGTGTEASAVATNYSGEWWEMNVTTIVKKMMNDTYPLNGFLVRDLTESGTSQWTTFYASDASSPHKPELVIYYVNNYGSRPYQSLSSFINVNCMGYAIEYNQYIDRGALNITDAELINKTTSELLTLVYSKSKTWMNSNIGTANYIEIQTYDADISVASPGWFRAVLRVGFSDLNGNGRYDTGETFDYHWWYQTQDDYGVWADKPGASSSRKQYGSNGYNPASLSWDDGPVNYNSAPKFFAIKDVRNNGW